MSSARRAKQERRQRRKARASAAASRRDERSDQCASDSISTSRSRLADAVATSPDALLLLLDMTARARVGSHSGDCELLPSLAWKTGFALAAADHVLEKLGAPWFLEEMGDSENENWLGQLRRGLDTYARICWCLRFGYTLAGVALARWFLERWTHNVAFSHEIGRLAGEDDVSFMNRVWGQYSGSMASEDVGRYWSDLSELLHGRSVWVGADQVRITLNLETSIRVRLHDMILHAAEIPLRQVRGCISVLADEHKTATDARAYLQAPVNLFPEAPDPPDFLSVFSPPLDFDYVTSTDSKKLTPWGETYRTMIRRGEQSPLALNGFHSWMSIEERWVRFTDEARHFFTLEAERTGDAFDPDALRGLLAQYRAITEMAELVAEDLGGSQRGQALQTAAAALESAWVLWLQDVDDSMIAMRSVLESTARARVHRLKPVKAEGLEARGARSTPHRWLEAAGWGRLAPFSRALGEFSHLQERSRHDESRELLTAIQRSALSGLEVYTARAGALEEVSRMLAHEVAAALDEIDSHLGAAFRSRVLFETTEETEARLVSWLNRALEYRSYSFGQANYPIPTADSVLTPDEVARVSDDPGLSSAPPPSVHPD